MSRNISNHVNTGKPLDTTLQHCFFSLAHLNLKQQKHWSLLFKRDPQILSGQSKIFSFLGEGGGNKACKTDRVISAINYKFNHKISCCRSNVRTKKLATSVILCQKHKSVILDKIFLPWIFWYGKFSLGQWLSQSVSGTLEFGQK